MTGDEDEIEGSAGPSGVSLKAKGAAATRLGHSLADLISPVSQTLGALGDHIRIFRENSVRAALTKARELATDRGEELPQVGPKNLLPWLENASLEDIDEEENLSEIFARLLLSGTREFDIEFALFTDSLKRMNARTIEVLHHLCKQYDEPLPAQLFAFLEEHHNRSEIASALSEAPAFRSRRSLSRWVERQLEDRYLPFAAVFEVDSRAGEANAPVYSNDLVYEQEIIDSLVREGFIEKRHLEVSTKRGSTMSVVYYQVTNLGLRLIVRCFPDEVQESDTEAKE